MLRAFLILPLALFTSACDPCSGIVGCDVGARVAYEGRVIDPLTGEPAVGVPVTFVRREGVALRDDTLRGVTNRNGSFTLATDAGNDGEVAGDLTVGTAYTEPVLLRTTRVRGDGRIFMKDWADQPFVNVALLLRAGPRSLGEPLPNATITFRRTGGVEVEPVPYTRQADASGNVPVELRADSVGEVSGELLLAPQGAPATVVSGVRFRTQTQVGRVLGYAVGPTPWLGYVGKVSLRDGTPVSNLVVRVRRTGGIATETEEVTRTTDTGGHFSMELIPLETGAVTVDVLAVRSGSELKIGVAVLETSQIYVPQFKATYTLPDP